MAKFKRYEKSIMPVLSLDACEFLETDIDDVLVMI